MTATPTSFTPFYPEAIGTQLPPGATIPLQANALAIGRGQLATFDANGNAALNDGTVPLLLAAGVGWPGLLSDTNANAGVAKALAHWGFGGMSYSTAVGDGFTAADIGGVPAFIASETTIGRKSNLNGNDRSIAGMVYGVFEDGLARFWGGPVAQAVARLVHSLNADAAGNVGYAADASASTDLGSASGGPPPTTLTTIGFVVPRAKRHGVVTSVEIIPSATQAHAATNYRVVQIWKVDTTGTVALAASPLVATFTTLTQDLTVGQPTAFTLGAASALLLRETDILIGTSIHFGSGVALPQSAIRSNFEVI